MVEVKTEKNEVTLPILITEKENTQTLLGLVWLDKLEIGLQGNRERSTTEHPKIDRVIHKEKSDNAKYGRTN